MGSTPTNVPISTAVDGCARSFLSLAESLRKPTRFAEQVAFEQILDEFDRFKLWAGNIAAHRKGRRSLEYRLRDAARLKAETQSLLVSLSHALHSAMDIVEERRFAWDEEIYSESDSDSDSDSYDHDGINNLQGSTELKQLYASIKPTITSLMRISMAIREPAPNREARSIDKSHFEQHDMFHVQNKFPIAPQHLAERLGRAISSRRQYLTYREVHHNKLAKDIDKLGLEAARTEFTTNSTEATRLQRTDSVNIMDDGDDTASMTSYATSVNATLRAPNLPKEAREKEYYSCPLCYGLIAIHTTAAWKRHVYQDLHPYCCTFENCTTADRLYDSRHAWFAHELDVHHSTFQCVEGCSKHFSTETEFEQHVRIQHDEFAAPGVFLALRRTSVKSAGLTERATCKLCDKNMTLRALQKHLGHHQEQLSLFALPTNLDEMEDDPDEEADDLPSMIGAISEEIDEEVTDTSDESEAEEMVVTTSQRDKYNISAQGDGAIETQVTADSGFNIQLPSFQGKGTGAIAQTENPAAAFEEFRGTAAPREQDDERLYTGSSHTDFRPADLPPRESHEKDASLEPAAVYGDETSPLDKAPSPEEDYRWDLFLVGNKNKKKKGKAVETEPDFIHSDAGEKPHGTDKVRTSASDPAPQVVVEGGEPKHRQDEDSIESKRERPARSGSQDEQTSNPVGPSVWSIREADEAVAKFVEEEVYMMKKEQEQRDEEEYRNFIRMQEEKKAANESVQGKGKERLGEASYHGLMEEQTEAHGRILAKAGHEQEEEEEEEEEEDAKRKPLIEEEKPEFEQEQRKREDEAKADKGESLRIVLEAQARRAKNLREGKIPEEMVGKEEAVLAEAALEEAMRKRLAQFGFQENQIQAMIHPEQQQKLEKNTGLTPHNPLRIAPQPTYAKVRREYLDIETLHYYDLPYEYDVDPNYIIVLREMNQREMDVLFEHTRRLRSNHGDRLFIEADGRDRRGKKEYAFARRKSRTRGTDAEDRDTEPR